jgi:flagellar L-ring protein FlgH
MSKSMYNVPATRATQRPLRHFIHAVPATRATQRPLRHFALIALPLLLACVPHIGPYTPKVRNFHPDKYASAGDVRDDGSLWSDSADSLFTHRRSSRVGDLVTILIEETSNATLDASTDLSRKSEISAGVTSFATAMSALKAAFPNLDPAKLLGAATSNEFQGKGATSSSGKLNATLTARIKQVLPNGDMYIEGSKVVMINQEESHIYLSGVVRPSDIQADNTVASNLIADAQVEYTGRGAVADKQKPGWFTRFFDWVSPF